MKFSLAATIALASILQVATAAAVPIIEDDVDDFNSTSIDLEERGLFDKYPCTRGVKIKMFKHWTCKGSATRTDITNWPLPEGYDRRCQEVNSISDMQGITASSPMRGAPNRLWVQIYNEPGCKGKWEKTLIPNGNCEHHEMPYGQDPIRPIKSFKVSIDGKKPWECKSVKEDGT